MQRFQAETDRSWRLVTGFLLVVFQERDVHLILASEDLQSRFSPGFNPSKPHPAFQKAKPSNLVSSSINK
jgi:hypothetical protein